MRILFIILSFTLFGSFFGSLVTRHLIPAAFVVYEPYQTEIKVSDCFVDDSETIELKKLTIGQISLLVK